MKLNIRDVFYLVTICFLVAIMFNSDIQCPQHVAGVMRSGLTEHSEGGVTTGARGRLIMLQTENDALRNKNNALDTHLLLLQRQKRQYEMEVDRQRDILDQAQVDIERLNIEARALKEELAFCTAEQSQSVQNLDTELSPKELPDRSSVHVIDHSVSSLTDTEEEAFDEQHQDLLMADNETDAEFFNERIDDEEAEALDIDDDDDEDEEEENLIGSGSGYEIVNAAGNTDFRLTSQVDPTARKYFKVHGTKFLSLFSAFEHAGWKRSYSSQGYSLVLTKPVTKIPGSRGKIINQVASSSCIGGSKGAQLRCKAEFAKIGGCNFFDFDITPRQYNLHSRAECEAFFAVAQLPENVENKSWIAKDGGSYHGRGVKLYNGLKSEITKKYGKCSRDKETGPGMIMQEYVAQPALLGGKKFDVRSYLLIASTRPYMVFYHPGFARRSAVAYSRSNLSKLGHITNHKSQDKYSDHFLNFQNVSHILNEESGFPKHFMETVFKKHAKHVTNYIFQAARSRMKRRSGAFMLFGIDWILDENENIHFLEANGNPSISNYPGTDLGPKVWDDMANLVTTLHRTPEKLSNGTPKTSEGFSYGSWELVFNEAEEAVQGDVYEPCQFRSYVDSCSDANTCIRW